MASWLCAGTGGFGSNPYLESSIYWPPTVHTRFSPVSQNNYGYCILLLQSRRLIYVLRQTSFLSAARFTCTHLLWPQGTSLSPRRSLKNSWRQIKTFLHWLCIPIATHSTVRSDSYSTSVLHKLFACLLAILTYTNDIPSLRNNLRNNLSTKYFAELIE